MGEGNFELRLPRPALSGELSLEQLLRLRRSIRIFRNIPLSVFEVGQLLWAAQGITSREGQRTASSAGGCYPLELFAVIGNVDEIEPGIYRYHAEGHWLARLYNGDRRRELADAIPEQKWLRKAPVVMALTVDYRRSMNIYGKPGRRLADLEAGHAAQNLLLQAVSLGLASVVVGDFACEAVTAALRLPPHASPVVVMPVGCE